MTDPLIGQRLGRYELKTFLGKGGTASVYRALDTTLHRDVAVKILSNEALNDPEFIQRFDREARTLAGLRHPNIVQIYDYGQQNGLNYIVTHFLPGPTLEEEVEALNARGARMETAKALQTLAQVSSALDYAHKQGIIHRDIKPANVIRDTDGDAVLTDFGIAKAAASSGVTQVGTVIGTPAYLSPEQAQGVQLAPASDIYSLGILAFELLTGRVPFDDPNPMSILLDQVETPPPAPSSFRPDLPVTVDQVLLKVLAKDPAARFPSAGLFVRALTTAWQKATAPALPSNAVHNQPTAVYTLPVAAPNRQPAPPVDIHNQVTVANPQPAAPRPQPAQARPPSSPPPVVASPAPKVYRHTPWPLIIGLLLGLALIGGVIAALRTNNDNVVVPPIAILPTASPTDLPPTDAPAVAPTDAPTVAPTDAPPTAEPTQPPPPTAEPTQPPPPTAVPPPTAPAATDEPLPTVAVIPATPAPPPASLGEALVAATNDDITEIRFVIGQNRDANVISQDTAKDLLDNVDDLVKQITEGDKKDAIEEVDNLWDDINKDVEKRRMPPDVGDQLHNALLRIRGKLK